MLSYKEHRQKEFEQRQKDLEKVNVDNYESSPYFQQNSFTKKENSTISIRRVGSKIGYVKITEDSDNINTHWFIKINSSLNIKILNLLIKLNNINFNKDNNVGALSISKQDIIKKYNKLSKEFYEASIIRGVSL